MRPSTPKSPLISVIVPVFNQWNLVPQLLLALQAQRSCEIEFEVLLVDNGSEMVPEAGNDPPFAHRLACNTPGSYAARNYGAARATGRILAFTDADCRPSGNWLAEALKCMQEGEGRTLVAGGISIRAAAPPHPNRYELYDMMLGMPQARYVHRGYAITANLFIPREVFQAVGGFDERRFSGGDADFCRRATAHGFALKYCGKSFVEHPARNSLEALVTKVRRVKGGQLTSGPIHRRMLWLIRAFLPPLRAWARALMSADFSFVQRVTVCIVQTRLWLAEMAEVFRLLMGRPAERR